MATIDDLTFTLLEDKSGYSVKATSALSISGNLDIPSEYNGLPVSEIEAKAFYSCDGLTSITIPSSVTSIGSSAFKECDRLTSITIPSSITSIGSQTFYGCTGLTSIMIPSSVTSIGSQTFYGCTGLTSIMIPSSVTSIGQNTFGACTSLTSIVVEIKNTVYHSDSNCCIESATNILTFGCKNSVIPDYVTSIGNSAFYGCTSLSSITIPSNVTSIGQNAFLGCTSLSSITIPSNVTSIEYFAFKGCKGLTYFKFEGNVISGSRDVLYDTPNLECVYINSDATGWGETWCGKTVVIDPESYFSFTLSSNGTYYSVKAKNASISGELEIPAEYNGLPVKVIEDNAFYNCTELTSVTIPSSVTTIGASGFYRCTGLTSVTIPLSITKILGSAFQNCVGLNSVTIPSSVTSIGASTFSSCTSLTYFKFEGNAISESASVLDKTPNLKCVYINPDATGWGSTWGGKPVVKVSSIGNAVKSGETSLIEIKLGEITIYSMFIGDDQLF